MATYYVSTTGSDSNNGTAADNAHAWLTIAHAEATVTSSDTVNLAAGTYTWPSSRTWNSGATYTGPALAVGSNKPTAIIDGGAAKIITTLNNYFTFNNIQFQNINNTSASSYDTTSLFTTSSNAGNKGATFNNCAFTNITIANGNGNQPQCMFNI